MPTVIAPNDYNGIVAESGFIESVDHATDLGIDVTDAGEVRVFEGSREFWADGAVLGDAVAGA